MVAVLDSSKVWVCTYSSGSFNWTGAARRGRRSAQDNCKHSPPLQVYLRTYKAAERTRFKTEVCLIAKGQQEKERESPYLSVHFFKCRYFLFSLARLRKLSAEEKQRGGERAKREGIRFLNSGTHTQAQKTQREIISPPSSWWGWKRS